MSTRTVASRPQSGRLYVVLLVVLLWVIAAPVQSQEPSGKVITAERPEVVRENGKTVLYPKGRSAARPTHLIVKLRPGKAAAFLPATARAFPRRPDLFLVPAPAGTTAEEAARQYARRADVLYAEPDYPTRIDTEPNDPRWSEQWDMVKIAAPTAWSAQTNSADVVVAVVDTGINFSHPDLQANVWTDPLDGTHGFTCLNGTVAPGGLDDNGHGTHVAGTIGAVGDNGVGVAGINWSVQLLALKAFNAAGNGNVSDAVACIDKMVELKQRGINIRVSNHSWSTMGYSQALRDAVANAESAGVLQVCAAGNSSLNLEFHPNYPAAFEGRGILAVAATDAADLPASFTNSGSVSVDLAAPGVDILSTVPTGPCSNCYPSGYRLLSGTSMAAPHVTGAAAALFHLNPALTPAEARDILLDPGSVDPLTNPSVLAYSTTQARLNVAKAINSPLVAAPRLNGFPQVSAPAHIQRPGADYANLAATVSDPDGDTVRVQWGKPFLGYLVSAMINTVFSPGWFYPPVANSNPLLFATPALARPATVEYLAFANDGRGGSATAQTWLNVLPVANPGQPPSGTLTVTPASGPVGTEVTVRYTGSDPEGGPILYGSIGPVGICCYSPDTTYKITFNGPTVARFSAQSIDRELNLSPWSSVVVRIGGATGEPPFAALAVDQTDGIRPLTVSYDATGSYDADGGTLSFFSECERGTSIVLYPSLPTGTCTYDTPGAHVLGIYVSDNEGHVDERFAYIMVGSDIPPDTSPETGDAVAPAVAITIPSAGATLSGFLYINAQASDNVGVSKLEFYFDSRLLATLTATPYYTPWDASLEAPGPHTLSVKGYDPKGNVGVASIPITVVDTKAPTIAMTAPASGSFVTGIVTINADASDNVQVTKVEFFNDGALLGTDATAPFSLAWNTTAAAQGVRFLSAKAYDDAGNAGSTPYPLVMVTVDRQAPAASITAPAAGATVTGLVAVNATASDSAGIARVEIYRDGSVLLGTDTTAPYGITWDTATATAGAHTLSAKAYDNVGSPGNMGTSAAVSVTVLDTTPPATSITSPAEGALVTRNASTTIAASASDNIAVTKVEFYVGTALTCTDTSSPYTCSWKVPKTAGVQYTLQAKAYDARNNVGASTVIHVTAN